MPAHEHPTGRLASTLLLGWALLRALTVAGVALAALVAAPLGELTPLLLGPVVVLIGLRIVALPHEAR